MNLKTEGMNLKTEDMNRMIEGMILKIEGMIRKKGNMIQETEEISWAIEGTNLKEDCRRRIAVIIWHQSEDPGPSTSQIRTTIRGNCEMKKKWTEHGKIERNHLTLP